MRGGGGRFEQLPKRFSNGIGRNVRRGRSPNCQGILRGAEAPLFHVTWAGLFHVTAGISESPASSNKKSGQESFPGRVEG
jgi:hypothetical protein